MANYNIQMNMLNSSGGYDVLWPETDYNKLVNLSDLSSLSQNGLKYETGMRAGTLDDLIERTEVTVTIQLSLNRVLYVAYNSYYKSNGYNPRSYIGEYGYTQDKNQTGVSVYIPDILATCSFFMQLSVPVDNYNITSSGSIEYNLNGQTSRISCYYNPNTKILSIRNRDMSSSHGSQYIGRIDTLGDWFAYFVIGY